MALTLAVVMASGCAGNDSVNPPFSTNTPPLTSASPSAIVSSSEVTIADFPSVTDPALYRQTCAQLHATQNTTGLGPGSSDVQVHAFIAAQQQTSWWPALSQGRQDTYVRAVRDVASGRC